MSSGILFVSEQCVYCDELLSRYEQFRPDLSLNVVYVDEPDKKIMRLIDVYNIEGVPTLVVDNEKHSEGEDVFITLLKRTSKHRSNRTQHRSDREVLLAPADEEQQIDTIDFMGSGDDLGAPLDFETPECSRGNDDVRGGGGDAASKLDDRIREIENMRKQSDEKAKAMNQTISDRKMMTTRQMEYDENI